MPPSPSVRWAAPCGRPLARRRPASRLAWLWLAPLLTLVVAQELPARREGGAVYLQVSALARALGAEATSDGSALTLRTSLGILTAFADSPEVLWQPASAGRATEQSLSAPALQAAEGWWLPLDAAALLGFEVAGERLSHPAGGVSYRLSLPAAPPAGGSLGEIVDLGRGVPGLRLYAPLAHEPRGQSMLLFDAEMLALIDPSSRERVDRMLGQAAGDHPLLFTVTSVAPSSWEAAVRVEQAGRELELRHPYRMQLLQGDGSVVGPEQPVVGILLLPSSFSLRLPLRLGWAGAEGEVTFRR